MARRKIIEKNIRKLSKVGGGRSFGITIPKGIVKELGWRERQRIEVRKSGQKIIIEKYKK